MYILLPTVGVSSDRTWSQKCMSYLPPILPHLSRSQTVCYSLASRHLLRNALPCFSVLCFLSWRPIRSCLLFPKIVYAKARLREGTTAFLRRTAATPVCSPSRASSCACPLCVTSLPIESSDLCFVSLLLLDPGKFGLEFDDFRLLRSRTLLQLGTVVPQLRVLVLHLSYMLAFPFASVDPSGSTYLLNPLDSVLEGYFLQEQSDEIAVAILTAIPR